MAYYTKINKLEFQKYLNNYSIGNVLFFKGIEEGIENTNYFFETKKKEKYILTIYENKITERIKKKNLSFFIELINFLKRKNFPCPQILYNNKRKQLSSYKNKKYAIINFIEGNIAKKTSNKHCYNLGKSLAIFHKTTLYFNKKRKNDFSLNEWSKIIKKNKLPKKDSLFLKKELRYLKKNWPKRLPSGIIHGDLFPDNVFFKKNNIVGIIDLSNACNDFFCYDLSICINAWCYKEKLDLQKMKSLIRGYNSIRKINTQEIKYLNFFLRASSLRFYLSRLMDSQNKKIPKKYNKNPNEYLNKLKYFQSNNLKKKF